MSKARERFRLEDGGNLISVHDNEIDEEIFAFDTPIEADACLHGLSYFIDEHFHNVEGRPLSLRFRRDRGEEVKRQIAKPEFEDDLDSDVWIVQVGMLAKYLFRTIHGEDDHGGSVTYYDKSGTGYTTENGTYDALPPFKKEAWEAAARSIIALLPEAGS